jgi:hypothetical protein
MFDFLKPKQEPEEEIPVEQPADVDFSDDPIDKIFGFFFGAKEEEPMGMKRFGREKFPEQYPAVIDEWAEPVEGDSPDVAALRPLLKKTNLEFRGLKVLKYADCCCLVPKSLYCSIVDSQTNFMYPSAMPNTIVANVFCEQRWMEC